MTRRTKFNILISVFIVILFILTGIGLKKNGNNFLMAGNKILTMIMIGVIFITVLLIGVLFIIINKPPRYYYRNPNALNPEKELKIDFNSYDKKKRIKITDKFEYEEHQNKKKLNNSLEKEEKPSDELKIEFINKVENNDSLKALEETSDNRFYMLSDIDKRYENYIAPTYNDKISLEEFCEKFRLFSAGRLKLYYSIEDIRRFIGGLAVTKLLILQGMSGTGKTSLAYAFGEFLDNKTTVVPIQPMWKERTDLIGYYNEFTRKFNETTLLYTMYEANYNKEIYITVLDEMNIARVEYYFAEFLSLLELPNPEGRNLDVVSDVWETDPKLLHDGKLRLPTNMWYIGTANNDDSTFAISDKVYDRAMVLNLDKKAEPFEAENVKPVKISIDHLEELFNKAMKEYAISQRNLRRIKKLDDYLIDTFHITFGNRIMKQIKTYVPVLVACGGSEVEALDDILSRKVLRKLESKNPVYVRSQADALCNLLDELFGVDKMKLCKEAIRNIEQNV